jgi:hypothetical protein
LKSIQFCAEKNKKLTLFLKNYFEGNSKVFSFLIHLCIGAAAGRASF